MEIDTASKFPYIEFPMLFAIIVPKQHLVYLNIIHQCFTNEDVLMNSFLRYEGTLKSMCSYLTLGISIQRNNLTNSILSQELPIKCFPPPYTMSMFSQKTLAVCP